MTARFRRSMASRVLVLGALALAISAAPAQAANATSFSGEATVIDVEVENPLGGALLLDFRLGHAGPLPTAGGSDIDEHLNVNLSPDPLTLTASVIRARTDGSGSTAESIARVSNLNLAVDGIVDVESTTLRSVATARCGANGPVVSGDSIIEDLRINDIDVVVSGDPNQHVELTPLIDVYINEQDSNVTGSYGEITVTALRIVVDNPLNGDLARVILSRAHADVTCPEPNGGGGPDGGIGGPCHDPAYYGIFDNSESSVAHVFRFRWYNGNGLQTLTKTVPAGAIFRTWEKWVKAFTTMRVGYFNPATGRWVNLETRQSVKGNYPPCVYQRGFEYPNP